MDRYTKKDADGLYYIESANGKLVSDKFGHTYGESINRFAEFENSDVVPKSEIERLQAEIEELKKAKTEGTMEIFAEIDDIFLMFKPQYFVDAPHVNYKRLTDLLAKLKKKYAEKRSDKE